MKKLNALIFFSIACILCNYSSNAQTNFSEIHGFEPHFILPPGLDAGKMANIKTDFGAKGDGVTDDTQAFKTAIEGDHPRTLYIPEGTYLINDQLRFGLQASKKKRVLLIGERRSTTIIRLKDGSSGFGSASSPKVVLHTRQPNQQGEQNMHHYIQHITIEIGKNNPGAIGMNYHSNNTGAVKDVAIRAVDPANHPGHIGIDISDWGAGPANIRFVEIDGFKTGINLKEDNQFTFEHIVLKNCQTGIYATTAASMRKIKAINCDVGIHVKGAVAILDADIQGGNNGDAVMVENDNVMIKNLVTGGYSKAINTTTSSGDGDQNGPNVSHWVSKNITHLWDPDAEKNVTLGLFVEESPEYQYAQSSAEWALATNASEVQSAIDAGKSHVYIPRDLALTGNIYLRKNVKHIMFMGESSPYSSDPVYILQDGTSDAVIIELSYGGIVKQESPRTVVLRHCALNYNTEPGGYGGKVFSESNTCNEINLTQAKGWFRDLNTERGGKTPTVTVDNGSMWVLGQKTEDFATKLKVVNGGFLELIGGTYRMNWDQEDFDRAGLDRNNPPPLFEIDNANASFAGFTSWGPNIPFDPVIREKRGSTTRNLARSGNNGAQALYVGYTEKAPDNPVAIEKSSLSNVAIYPNPVTQHLILELPENQEPYVVKLYDISGKTMLSEKKPSGKQSIDISGIANGIYVLECTSGTSREIHKVVIQ